MFQIFLVSIVFCALISSIDSQEFCDNQYKNNLIDLIFNFNETVYVYRSTAGFWILKYQRNTNEWQIIGGPHSNEFLFPNITKAINFEMRAILAISSYVVCDRKSTQCPNNDRSFDPTNVTFIFGSDFGRVPDDYLIYRRYNQTSFMTADPSDQMIPWLANIHPNNQSLKTIDEPIGAALFVMKANNFHDYAVFLTDNYSYEYDIIDKATQHTVRVNVYDKSIKTAEKHGAISHEDRALFFMSNKVWNYDFNGFTITPMNQTYWQFFNCPETTDTFGTDPFTDVFTGESTDLSLYDSTDFTDTFGTDSFTDIFTEESTDLSSDDSTNFTDTFGTDPFTDTFTGESTDLSIYDSTDSSDADTDYSTDGPKLKSTDNFDDFTDSETTVYDDTTSIPSKPELISDGIDYPMVTDPQSETTGALKDGIHSSTTPMTLISKIHYLLRNLSLILFLTTVGTAIIITVFAVYAFISLSQELS